MKRLKHALRYLKETAGLKLLLGGRDEPIRVVGYSDADFAGDRDSRRSTSGYLFKLGIGSVSWRSKLQGCVARSSTESEYMSMGDTGAEGAWMHMFLGGLGYDQGMLTLLGDNLGANVLTNSTKLYEKSKHIQVQFHYIRELVERKIIRIFYCRTDRMVADLMTKLLGRIKTELLRSMMGVVGRRGDRGTDWEAMLECSSGRLLEHYVSRGHGTFSDHSPLARDAIKG